MGSGFESLQGAAVAAHAVSSISAIVAVCRAAFAEHAGVFVELGELFDSQAFERDVPTDPVSARAAGVFVLESDADEVAIARELPVVDVECPVECVGRDVDVGGFGAERDAVCWRQGQYNHLQS